MGRATHFSEDLELQDAHFWRDAIVAGICGGIVFLAAKIALGTLLGEDPLTPLLMIAAIVLGTEVLPTDTMPVTLDMGVALTALALHLSLSIVYGLIIGALIQRTTMHSYMIAMAAGTAVGLVIYLLNFFFIALFVFDWFGAGRNGVNLATHALYGVVTASIFLWLATPQPRSSVA